MLFQYGVNKLKRGTFKRELKNRFLCEIEIDGENNICYVPSSCHLSHFVELAGKEVLIVPNLSKKSKTKYSLFAVPYKRNYIVLNTSVSNRIIESSIKRRLFSYLGNRKNVMKEHNISGYKCDLYIEDTNTIVEIKSIISEGNIAIFPTVYSERSIKQMKAIKGFLKANIPVCYCIVSLSPYAREIRINHSSEFYGELMECVNLGMFLHGYAVALKDNGLVLKDEIPISF